MITVDKVSKKYEGHQALSQLSLSIKPGAIFGLLGPNGAGKTTLIRIINQIIAPDTGTLFFNGEKLQPKHIVQIGYLPEERGLYPKMKVAEQLIYLGRLKGLAKADAHKKVTHWLNHFQLTSWQNKTVEELSKGMAQKVQFIATILHEPKLLIFDEPFTGFDPINTNLIKAEILKLREDGATVIFSTHRMDSVEEICDAIALINKSEKIIDGSLADVKQRFSEGVLRFEIEGPLAELPPNFELLNQSSQNGITEFSVKPTAGSYAREALAYISQQYPVKSFNEVVPSLNDIFIKQVQQHG
jgi:ABC-2 type transport system ATP-binding protein